MLLLRVLAEKDPVFFEYGPLLAAYETLVPSVRVYLWVWGGEGVIILPYWFLKSLSDANVSIIIPNIMFIHITTINKKKVMSNINLAI